MHKIKILYVCNEDMATTKQRLLSLKHLDVDVDVVYTYLLKERIHLLNKLVRSVRFRLGLFPERNNENRQLVKCVSQKKYDILFIEKGLSIKPATIRKAIQTTPRLKVVSYSLDDIMNKKNTSHYFRKSLPLYDYVFTNKKYNVSELKKLGAKNVLYFKNGFSEEVHRPIEVSNVEKEYFGAPVSFIGTYEHARVGMIRFLAENGIKIKIWGWGKETRISNMIHPNIIMTGKYVYDEEYPKVVCSSKINLCFLRKQNRDTETTRSVEIPACGGFMLAERTNDHLELFEENKEAAYFSSKEELLQKIKYYLEHETERIQIGINGFKRCIKSEYSYRHQLKKIISIVIGYDAFSDN